MEGAQLPSTSFPVIEMSRPIAPTRTLAFMVWLLVLVSPLVGCASLPTAATPELGPPTSAWERQILVTVVQTEPTPLRGAGSTTPRYMAADGYSRTERTRRLIHRLGRDYELRRVEGWPIRALRVYCVVFEVPSRLEIGEVIAKLASDDRVESVQAMQQFHSLGGERDPYSDLQYGLHEMRIGNVHRWATGVGVTIAIVDTGVDRLHPDLAPRIAQTRDFVSLIKSETVPAERHGTAVAGVIASAPNNGVGTIGVAPNARILALRACWQEDQSQVTGTCSSFTLAKALAFVIEQRPQVLNLSLGGPRDPLLERLIEVALERGIAVVAAYSIEGNTVVFPASLEGVLAVQSNGSEVAAGILANLLSAPGEEILTTSPGGAFGFVSGSSYAAAHVSGLVALLLEHKPRLDSAGLLEVLKKSAVKVGGKNGSTRYWVDGCAAVRAIHLAVRCDGAAVASTEREAL